MVLFADSEGADAQADMCLRCPHMPKGTVLHSITAYSYCKITHQSANHNQNRRHFDLFHIFWRKITFYIQCELIHMKSLFLCSLVDNLKQNSMSSATIVLSALWFKAHKIVFKLCIHLQDIFFSFFLFFFFITSFNKDSIIGELINISSIILYFPIVWTVTV